MPRIRFAVLVLATAAVCAAVPASAAEAPYLPAVPYDTGLLGAAGNGQGSVASADLDGDADADIAMVDASGAQLRVIFNNGAGAFSGQVLLNTGAPSDQAVEPVDLDRDGLRDIVSVNQQGTLSVFHNDGSRAFRRTRQLPVMPRAYYIEPGDYNRDGFVDVAVLGTSDTGEVIVLLGDGDGGLTAQPAIRFGEPLGLTPDAFTERSYPAFQQLDSGDVNGDGALDLVTVGGTKLYVFLGRGDATFAPVQSREIVNPGAMQAVQLADLNRDDTLDAVVPVNAGATVRVMLGNGDGTFAAPLVSTIAGAELGTVAVAVGVADVNGDGILDLGVSGGLDHLVWIMTGDGTGRFSAVQSLPITSAGVMQEGRAVVPAQLNSDGVPDFVVGTIGLDSKTWVLLHR